MSQTDGCPVYSSLLIENLTDRRERWQNSPARGVSRLSKMLMGKCGSSKVCGGNFRAEFIPRLRDYNFRILEL